MTRKIIRRYLPDAAQLRTHPRLRLFSRWLQSANLWHLNRRSVPGAVAVGLFWAFIPSPTQLLPAAATAIALRVNLPLSLALFQHMAVGVGSPRGGRAVTSLRWAAPCWG